MQIFNWPFTPENAAAVAGWGFWIGLLGLLASAIGFAVTFVQLRRTRTAAQEAKRASEEARTRVASYDMIFELSKAASALENTQSHIRREDWAEAFHSYAEARIALVKISQLPSKLTQTTKDQISAIADQIERTGKRMSLNHTKGVDRSEQMRALQTNTDYQVALTRINASLDRVNG
ncbi:hypothetical protein BrevBR_09095 [Brevundimonas sp. BR2-1]|uniref:hypothetical protein n=1 Tax=Brevundimonas sp. BR2-1 TaxID=3031123 RepID=UPI00309B683D